MKVCVDRIEGELAVLVVVDNDSIGFNLPLSYLPGEVQAGDYFDVTFTRDQSSRRSATESVGRLLEDLASEPEKTDFQL